MGYANTFQEGMGRVYVLHGPIINANLPFSSYVLFKFFLKKFFGEKIASLRQTVQILEYSIVGKIRRKEVGPLNPGRTQSEK